MNSSYPHTVTKTELKREPSTYEQTDDASKVSTVSPSFSFVSIASWSSSDSDVS